MIMLDKKTESTQILTEKIKNDISAVLVPNPGENTITSVALLPSTLAARAEAFFFSSVPVNSIGLKSDRLTNHEYLGNDMLEAGNEFGTSTPYGCALVRVGHAEQR